MPKKLTPEEVSKMMSGFAKKRKNPYRPFKDNPNYAKQMSLKAVEARRKKREEQKASESQDSAKS